MNEEITLLTERIQILENIIQSMVLSDRLNLPKTIQMQDGRNIIFANGTGTKIGTEVGQKLAFFGSTPIIQQLAISAPSGGATIDAQARTAITSILTLLGATKFGFTA